MVGGKRRKSGRRELVGSHQKSWLYGRHAVLESLRAGRWTPLEVWIAEDLEHETRVEATAAAARLGVKTLDAAPGTMTRRCGGLAHQGLMALMPPFPYADTHAVLDGGGRSAFFIVLDGVQDPYNFGAILRSADVFGANGVFVPTANQCDVTVQVARSSAGAVNYVPIAQAPDLAELLVEMTTRGIRRVAAAGTAQRTLTEIDLSGPVALLIGNEGIGVRPDLVAACDDTARIPQSGHVESLNAAVAAGILCYEVQRQRKQ
ncbi:MAG: 23S rRNA (guanosine(2251)-2'-O)-methyltransferase RlmB [Planctomycetaceae bacterium]|nr:23S rRNA (guanosine(2251)-2'-O)-methyltransferase RlmB [Planctomycetaceae bacterium]